MLPDLLHGRDYLDARPLRWHSTAQLHVALIRLARAWGARLVIGSTPPLSHLNEEHA